jgi:transposase
MAFGIDGTGSYGAGLASLARSRGHRVVEVARPDRRERRLRGKNDLLDAGNAARAVLSRLAEAAPKNADGTVEQIRQLKIAKTPRSRPAPQQ